MNRVWLTASRCYIVTLEAAGGRARRPLSFTRRQWALGTRARPGPRNARDTAPWFIAPGSSAFQKPRLCVSECVLHHKTTRVEEQRELISEDAQRTQDNRHGVNLLQDLRSPGRHWAPLGAILGEKKRGKTLLQWLQVPAENTDLILLTP